MSFNYSQALNTAERLINFFNPVKAVILRSELNNYDPVEGTSDSETVYATYASAVSLPASNSKTSNFDNRQNDLKNESFRYFIVSAKDLEFEPKQNDLFVWQNGIYNVSGVTPLNTTGANPVYYKIGGQLANRQGYDIITIIEEGAIYIANDISAQDVIDRLTALENEPHLDFRTLDPLP